MQSGPKATILRKVIVVMYLFVTALGYGLHGLSPAGPVHYQNCGCGQIAIADAAAECGEWAGTGCGGACDHVAFRRRSKMNRGGAAGVRWSGPTSVRSAS
ncbi:MAG: hypothetical protein R3E01_01390 [Pirellulaceae bacterium]|nr:hypothetical protein [Planctomycetales bacterium]